MMTMLLQVNTNKQTKRRIGNHIRKYDWIDEFLCRCSFSCCLQRVSDVCQSSLSIIIPFSFIYFLSCLLLFLSTVKKEDEFFSSSTSSDFGLRRDFKSERWKDASQIKRDWEADRSRKWNFHHFLHFCPHVSSVCSFKPLFFSLLLSFSSLPRITAASLFAIESWGRGALRKTG